MAEFKEIINRLDKFSKTINAAIVGLAIFEAVLVIVIGIISNNLNTANQTINKIALYLLLFFGFLYLFILFIKTLYNKSFPGSIANELKSERELSLLIKNSERQKTINDFLVITIQRLNGQTCALNYGDDTNLCDTGIREGIYELMEPVIGNIDFILDTVNTNFTIGIFLEAYCSMAAHGAIEGGIITIVDKLGKEHLLIKDLLLQSDVKEEQLSIQTAIRRSLNNSEFVKQDFPTQENEFTIICSPIPFACNEEDNNGVFFIISKKILKVPDETETNLKIFNRVIANWVYRYDECITNRQEKMLNQHQNTTDNKD